MGVLKNCINGLKVDHNPIWLMRQAGRYLPEFRKIRSKNPEFIRLCLDSELSKEITIQPLKRFSLDAAIIFSDILLIPFALGQNVKFEKNSGPILDELNLQIVLDVPDIEIIKKLNPIYKLINNTSKDKILFNKDLIGFIGGTWTLLVYMLNKKSPKKEISQNIFTRSNQNALIKKIIHTQKIHIKNQVENGASIIQIFDSWAGLLDQNKFDKYIYEPTKELVDYVKKIGANVICFPRNIKNYKEYCDIIKPDAISIDYEIDPNKIAENIEIPIQGGMDPKFLLLDKFEMLKKAKEYLEVFKNHNYIFNLGHGVMPETNPDNVKILVDFVKGHK